MEMNGRVMRGFVGPVHLGPVPIGAGHGTGGKVDEAKVRAGCGPCGGRGNVLAEIPGADWRAIRRDQGRFDLAIEMSRGATIPPPGGNDWPARQAGRFGQGVRHLNHRVRRPAKRGLGQGDLALRKTRVDPAPVAQAKRCFGRQKVTTRREGNRA